MWTSDLGGGVTKRGFLPKEQSDDGTNRQRRGLRSFH
jgi:hypothetical protein